MAISFETLLPDETFATSIARFETGPPMPEAIPLSAGLDPGRYSELTHKLLTPGGAHLTIRDIRLTVLTSFHAAARDGRQSATRPPRSGGLDRLRRIS